MRRLVVFNNVSLDGFFVDGRGDMSWAHRADPEWNEFTNANASSGGELVFGRITYEMMAAFWPSPMAREVSPVVADRMNAAPKVVFSRTLARAGWNNTRLFKDDLAGAVRRLKAEAGPALVVMGSGTVVAQLSEARLVDEYQLVVQPIVLGAGRTLFQGLTKPFDLSLQGTRTFKNGNVVHTYASRG
jgi:dihydrofolate reductase